MQDATSDSRPAHSGATGAGQHAIPPAAVRGGRETTAGGQAGEWGRPASARRRWTRRLAPSDAEAGPTEPVRARRRQGGPSRKRSKSDSASDSGDDSPGGPVSVAWSLPWIARAALVALGAAGALWFGLWLVEAPLPVAAYPCAPLGDGSSAPRWAAGLFWCGLNALSVLAFGTAHSVLARPHVRRLVAADESTFRAVYTALSGIHLAFVAATWRPVCASLWELGLPSSVRQYRWAVDALLAAPFFLGIAAASGAAPGGGLAFVGLGAASSRSSQTPSVSPAATESFSPPAAPPCIAVSRATPPRGGPALTGRPHRSVARSLPPPAAATPNGTTPKPSLPCSVSWWRLAVRSASPRPAATRQPC